MTSKVPHICSPTTAESYISLPYDCPFPIYVCHFSFSLFFTFQISKLQEVTLCHLSHRTLTHIKHLAEKRIISVEEATFWRLYFRIKLQVHQMTPKWPWRLQGQSYPTYITSRSTTISRSNVFCSFSHFPIAHTVKFQSFLNFFKSFKSKNYRSNFDMQCQS